MSPLSCHLLNKMFGCRKDVSGWLERTKDAVECELTKLDLSLEHSAMLITWMMLTLQVLKKLFIRNIYTSICEKKIATLTSLALINHD